MLCFSPLKGAGVPFEASPSAISALLALLQRERRPHVRGFLPASVRPPVWSRLADSVLRAAALLSCQSVLSSPCYFVTLSLCYFVTLLLCYLVTLLPCYFVTLLPCYLVTLLPCYFVTLLPCYFVTLLLCYLVTLLPCISSAIRLRAAQIIVFVLVGVAPQAAAISAIDIPSLLIISMRRCVAGSRLSALCTSCSVSWARTCWSASVGLAMGCRSSSVAGCNCWRRSWSIQMFFAIITASASMLRASCRFLSSQSLSSVSCTASSAS